MIGDVLTSSILFEALRKEYPTAQLDYLIYKHTKPVVENNPEISNIIIFDPKQDKGLKGLITYGQKLRKLNYNIVIDLYSKPYSALLAYATGAKIRIGIEKWYTKPLLLHVIKYDSRPQSSAGLAIENRLKLLHPLGIKHLSPIKPKVYLTTEEINWAQNYLSTQKVDMTRPIYMISILGSSGNKTYPENYMAEVLNFIASEKDCTLLYNYIPSQKAQVDSVIDLLSEKAKEVSRPDIFGKSLREFLALCSQCTALIGNEGGAINMAKALDIPTFAIFSPQVTKAAWSSFEGDRNYSVHLRDFRPDIFSGKSSKMIDKESSILYQSFEPHLIFSKLNAFIKFNSK
ncbi:glycosyltransferase family 9 protein [uncultured Christiangramia sp.]|uniref:glycosyltransferase family 9 protein n=1 Tax=uncultured Christiangramia sp. TaxID=503836 RepID=UPI00262142D3|nr:glycosyltransferase family 9 protein [uncultured Christiangramia sp.]